MAKFIVPQIKNIDELFRRQILWDLNRSLTHCLEIKNPNSGTSETVQHKIISKLLIQIVHLVKGA